MQGNILKGRCVMAYDETAKKATIKYIKDKQQRLEIKYKKNEYDTIIQPAIEKSGLPAATFIKQAIQEKIERDNLLAPGILEE